MPLTPVTILLSLEISKVKFISNLGCFGFSLPYFVSTLVVLEVSIMLFLVTVQFQHRFLYVKINKILNMVRISPIFSVEVIILS